MFKKILVANRGEIAVRIIKACRELGIRAVAVYSEADRAGRHVQVADEAVPIGPPPATESYLDMDRIVAAVRATGAEAVHPGYGFLAENAAFARRLAREGIVFIGPNPDALELVGDKLRARSAMERAGIPIIPGMKSAAGEAQDTAAAAKRIGFPVMIKASAGGGGKGMRIAFAEEDLGPALEAGRREAKAAFGDDSVYLEKFIEDPRHVEFQVLADNRGNIVHLYERECSIQRRHQKIVEETPSVFLDSELRRKMGETAREVLRVSGYNNAGTVEFLLDRDRNFYFLEVNARIQVEHPVTELTTGVDLVHQQIRIASGEPLGLTQDALEQRGHALECRIYAEDPANNFLPSSGKILAYREPSGPGVRVDGGVYDGWQVPVYYDPILAKLIVWAETRELARARMINALRDYVILGISTSVQFLRDVISHPRFRDGDTTTGFVKKYFEGWKEEKPGPEVQTLALAAAALGGFDRPQRALPGGGREEAGASPWLSLGNWRIGGKS
ncbi:MAG: acetyl-CoA carboxylase biotin carboxylase subunit [Candidatus Aminicenantes bacterium RBG_16_63_16]|nr:MAG: acetyl-CoA carboxylase biotin carboxylase subunit [Candidatus Aminicenantes bacterium RBG_16_63_16]